ncbi:MAG TPA: hypothetical protein VJN70_14260 [Gemmatimonadaceae bacterium]|nr:hypothetical protein [Gemmatimonadaceae bacterium]
MNSAEQASVLIENHCALYNASSAAFCRCRISFSRFDDRRGKVIRPPSASVMMAACAGGALWRRKCLGGGLVHLTGAVDTLSGYVVNVVADE